jgi:undecaprenyl diphosphate synthase
MATLSKISPDNLPKHVAIIMDGNRRWAKKHGVSDVKGHEAGADNLQKIVIIVAILESSI